MRQNAAKSVPHLLNDKQKKTDFLCAKTYKTWTGTSFLSVCEYFLLTKMKIQLKGGIMKDNVEIQVESQAVLDASSSGTDAGPGV